MANLQDLPADLVDILARLLPLYDIRSLRLSCKSLNIRSFYVFKNTFFEKSTIIVNSSASLKRLYAVSKHPVFREKIKHLHVKTAFHDVDVLSELRLAPTEPTSNQVVCRLHRIDTRRDHLECQRFHWAFKDARLRVATYRETLWDARRLRTGFLSKIQLIIRFPELQGSGINVYDEAYLTAALRGLENLRSIHLTLECVDRTAAIGPCAVAGHNQSIVGCMCSGFRTLTNALGKAENVRLERLTVGDGSLYSGPVESMHPLTAADVVRLYDCQHAFAGLKILKVRLSFERNRVDSGYIDKAVNIAQWLQFMPSLEDLHLGFEADPCVPSVFRRIANTCHFPNLRDSGFANAAFDHRDIQRFLKQHKSSLQSLDIENCPVLEGTWVSLFYWIRENLTLSHLKAIRVGSRTELQIWFHNAVIEPCLLQHYEEVASNDDGDDNRRSLDITRHSRFGTSAVYKAWTTTSAALLTVEETGDKLCHGFQLTGDVQTGLVELLQDGVYIRHHL